MNKQARVSHPFYGLLPKEIEGFDSLAELALNLRWSWNHATDEVWRQLDPKLWQITQNPWIVLQTVSHDQIERLLADPVFRKNVETLVLGPSEKSEPVVSGRREPVMRRDVACRERRGLRRSSARGSVRGVGIRPGDVA